MRSLLIACTWASSWAINGFVEADKAHDWSCHPLEHELSAFYDISLDALFEPFIDNEDAEVSRNLLIASPEIDTVGDDVINSLSADEKKLILYYRNSYRKDEIMKKAYDILCSDSAVADEIED